MPKQSNLSPPTSTTMSSCIAPSRLAALTKLRCSIFETSYNPTGVRTGAKYLRQRLRGPSMVAYYPKQLSLAHIVKKYPELGMKNTPELQRLDDVDDTKARGKGAPKKAATKADSRRAQKKR